MYLRKSLKGFQLIVYRQNCLNWCQIVANRKYSNDNNNQSDSSSSDEDKPKNLVSKKRVDLQKPSQESSEDKALNAKKQLNQLIGTIKTKSVFGKSDSHLKEVMAKPKFHIRRSARSEEEIDEKEEPINQISEQIDKRLVSAAKGIASTLNGDDAKITESDLLKLLKLNIFETNLAKEGKPLTERDMNSVLGDMKFDREERTGSKYFKDSKFKRPDSRSPQFKGPAQFKPDRGFADSSISSDFERRERRATQYRETRSKKDDDFADPNIGSDFNARGKRTSHVDQTYGQSLSYNMLEKKRTPFTRQRTDRMERIDLFKGESMGIFDPDMKEATDLPQLLVWDQYENDELQHVTAQPPKNAFEEMIQLTEEGKLWKFPINNEQGLEEEEKVPFYEHVLLDHLLEGFPETGAVRRFMELVILGLSSNPYITVQRKHATVEYYRQYFKEREDMLQLSGALG